MPLTSSSGSPLPLAEQQRRTTTSQPLPGGLRLIARPRDPREWRFTLATSTGQTVRTWRVTSQTDLGAMISTPELVGDDLVVTVEVARQTPTRHLWEIQALRLPAAGGTPTQYALDARAVWGSEYITKLRVGPNHALYQLRTSPTTGATIGRYSLDPGPLPRPATPATTTGPRPKTRTSAPAPTTSGGSSTAPSPHDGGTPPAVAAAPASHRPSGPSTLWLAPALAAAALLAAVGYRLLRRRPGAR